MDISYITPEIKALIGLEGEPQTSWEPVERSEVRRFAQAVMDDDPIFWNDTHAQTTRYGAVVAPPLFPLFAYRRALPLFDSQEAFFTLLKMAEFYMIFVLVGNAVRTMHQVRRQVYVFFAVAVAVSLYAMYSRFFTGMERSPSVIR